MCKFLRGFDPALTLRAAEKLGTVEMAALILWAEEDESFPMRLALGLARALPRAELRTVADARVFASLDAPDDVAEEIAAFVTRLRPTSGSRYEKSETAVA